MNFLQELKDMHLTSDQIVEMGSLLTPAEAFELLMISETGYTFIDCTQKKTRNGKPSKTKN